MSATAVNLFKSPTSRNRLASPRACLLQSPVSRRHSPRVLALESDVKTGPASPETTPEKELVCGIITAGLDSPCQNTRLRSAQTPTRKSVRAALFAKSPRACRVQSPMKHSYSPRTLALKFGSPLKKNAENLKSNVCSVPANISTEVISAKMNSDTSKQDVSDNGDIRIKPTVPITNDANNANSKQNTNVQKTPSPRSKKETKTPDSFSKWHRRKPRSTQAVHKLKAITETVDFGVSKQIPQTQKNTVNEIVEYALKPVQGTVRNKRCLLQSPEKLVVESPNKKARVVQVRQSSFVDNAKSGSQGFEPTESLGELSQISNISSDYFSVTNDEVFLSQNQNSDIEELTDLDKLNKQKKVRMRRNSSLLRSSQGFTSSPRRKALERMISSDVEYMDTSDNELPGSPIFGASRNAVYTMSKQTESIVSQNSDNFSTSVDSAIGVASEISSPKLSKISPNTKKYSPNVSAKSLMHLIQSPLLKSPESKLNKNSPLMSPTTKGRSRRSLKLMN